MTRAREDTEAAFRHILTEEPQTLARIASRLGTPRPAAAGVLREMAARGLAVELPEGWARGPGLGG